MNTIGIAGDLIATIILRWVFSDHLYATTPPNDASGDAISPVVVTVTPSPVILAPPIPIPSPPSLKADQLEFHYVKEDGIYYSNNQPGRHPPCQSCNLYHKNTDE